jgi:hypothetical protein
MSVTPSEIRDVVTKVVDDNKRLHKQLLDIRTDQASAAVAVQAAHDPTYRAFGDLRMEGSPVSYFEGQAPAPLQGESPTQYKRRSLENLKPYSKEYKDADLAEYSGDPLVKAERAILSDAQREAANPVKACPADGTMLQRVRKDGMGLPRIKERYSSRPGKVWDQFKTRPQLIKRWGDPRTGRYEECIPDHVLANARRS